MTIKAFKRPGQLSVDGAALAQAVEDFARQLTLNPLIGGRQIQRLDVSTTAQDVPHSLGRPWLGYVVTRRDGDLVVFESATQTDKTKFLTLEASASGTVDLYIF